MEKEETRKIKLTDGREAGIYGIGSVSIAAEPGKALSVPVNQARMATSTGNFEYVGEDIPPTKESLMKLKKEELVKEAVENHGASQYVERLTKEQLTDYILSPSARGTIEAEIQADANTGE